MSTKNLPILSLCAAAAAFSSVARADVIYSDFGSSDTFYTYVGSYVSDATTDYSPSFQFTPTSDYVLSEVDFVTSIGNDLDVNQVTITLSNDNSGIPGTSIASQEFTGDMGILGTSSGILTWSPDVDLTANTPYWITLDGPVPGDVTWNYNNQGASGEITYQGGTWSPSGGPLGAIDIIGTAVTSAPEPGTLLMFAAGLSAVVMAGRRRIRQ